MSPSFFLSHTLYTQPKTSIKRKTHKFPTVRGWGQVCSSSSIIPKDSWDAAVVPQLCDSASVRGCQSPKHCLFLFPLFPRPLPALSLCSPLSSSSSSQILCCREKDAVKRSHSAAISWCHKRDSACLCYMYVVVFRYLVLKHCSLL